MLKGCPPTISVQYCSHSIHQGHNGHPQCAIADTDADAGGLRSMSKIVFQLSKGVDVERLQETRG